MNTFLDMTLNTHEGVNCVFQKNLGLKNFGSKSKFENIFGNTQQKINCKKLKNLRDERKDKELYTFSKKRLSHVSKI